MSQGENDIIILGFLQGKHTGSVCFYIDEKSTKQIDKKKKRVYFTGGKLNFIIGDNYRE